MRILYKKQIRDILGISNQTFVTLMKRHGLGDYCFKIGSRWAITEKDLRAWIVTQQEKRGKK